MAVSLGGTEVFKNAHLSLLVDHTNRLVIVRRSALPFQKVEDVEAATAALAKTFPLERRRGFSILSDFRSAPTRVHPALEPAFLRYREESQRGFERCAVVVATALGRVRSDRLRDEAEAPVAVVGSIEEALEYLKQSSLKP